MTRFLVTGASGLLGLHFAWQAATLGDVIGVVNDHTLTGVPFKVVTADLAQSGKGRQLLEETHPDILVHCAALANVDACDFQPDLAKRLNADLPGELAKYTAEKGIKMLHISTDAVFNGLTGDYSETDLPDPLSIYAGTKLQGEQAVMAANPQALITRVNFFGWSISGKRSLAEWFISNLVAGTQVNGFTDIIFCPLEVTQLCTILLEMLKSELMGLYHVVSSEKLSKYDFGKKLASTFGLDETLINPVSWRAGGLLAARSPLLTLKTEKVSTELGKAMPGIQEGIERFFKAYQEGWPQQIRQLVVAS